MSSVGGYGTKVGASKNPWIQFLKERGLTLSSVTAKDREDYKKLKGDKPKPAPKTKLAVKIKAPSSSQPIKELDKEIASLYEDAGNFTKAHITRLTKAKKELDTYKKNFVEKHKELFTMD